MCLHAQGTQYACERTYLQYSGLQLRVNAGHVCCIVIYSSALCNYSCQSYTSMTTDVRFSAPCPWSSIINRTNRSMYGRPSVLVYLKIRVSWSTWLTSGVESTTTEKYLTFIISATTRDSNFPPWVRWAFRKCRSSKDKKLFLFQHHHTFEYVEPIMDHKFKSS